jgi:hypothetical protein
LNCRHLGVLAARLHARHDSARRAQADERRRLKLPEGDPARTTPGDPDANALGRALVRCLAVRTLRRLLRESLRDCCRTTQSASQANARGTVAAFLNLCLVEGPLSRHFWRARVLPDALRVYGTGLPQACVRIALFYCVVCILRCAF